MTQDDPRERPTWDNTRERPTRDDPRERPTRDDPRASPYDYAPTPAPRAEPYHRVGHTSADPPQAGTPYVPRSRDDAARGLSRWRRRGPAAADGDRATAPVPVDPWSESWTQPLGSSTDAPPAPAWPTTGQDRAADRPAWMGRHRESGTTAQGTDTVPVAQGAPPPQGTSATTPAGAPQAAPAGVSDIFAPSPDAAGWSRYGPDDSTDRPGVARGIVLLLVLVSLLAGILLGGLGARSFFDVGTTGASATLPVSSGAAVDRAPESVAGIAEAVLPSTVYIEARGAGQSSSGTGMVLREDGYLLTNNHVIEVAADGGAVVVVFPDGSEEEAEIVGRTSDYDLAVLRVDREGLTPLVLADSDTIAVGDPVIAVGAPLGLEGTVTTGIVSALNRPVRAGTSSPTFINAIQTDAAINPGNSGGPLVDAAGQVVGINSAIAQTQGATQATGSIGLGFAIPANQARRTSEQIIATGRATYPVIGVALDTRYTGEGVQVLEGGDGDTEPVTAGGPGDAAGIRPGDVILAIDGRPVTEPDELIVAIRSRAPGETVSLTIRRGQSERDVDVVLGEGP